MAHGKLVLVRAFGTEAEADLAKSVLDSAGIDAMIQADTAGRMRPHLAWSGFGFKVLVLEEDAASARALLEPPAESDLIVIETFPTQAEADSACNVLSSAGIFATTQDSAGGVGEAPAWRQAAAKVLVRKEDAEEARDFLKRASKKSV